MRQVVRGLAIIAGVMLGAVGLIAWAGIDASAQEVLTGVASTTEPAGDAIVDLWPIVEPLLELAAVALTVTGAWAIRRLLAWLKLAEDARVRAYLEEGWYSALAYGREVAEQTLRGRSAIEIRNVAVRHAADYMTRAFPDGLRHFGITPQRTQEILTAKLTDVFGPIPDDAKERPPAGGPLGPIAVEEVTS